MTLWLRNNDMEIYPAHNEEKYVVDERFIRNLKNKTYKYMTATSTNMYIHKLNDIVNECNSIYHRTIKTKPSAVKSSTYIGIVFANNDKDTEFEFPDSVRISKYRNVSAKGQKPNLSEEAFVIKKVK